MLQVRDRRRRGGRDRRRRGGRARQRAGHRLAQRQSVHHHARHHGAGARHRLSHHRRRAGERRDRPAGAFIAFGSDRLLGIHYLVWVPAILLAALSFVMHATPYGRRVYATGGSREAAYLSGVPVRRVIASTYVWCGALAGIAGVMLAARLQSGQPTAGEFYELTAIAAVVLGGASLQGGEGTLYKSVIGVFIMIVLGNALNLLNVDSYWQRVAVGRGHHCGRRRR